MRLVVLGGTRFVGRAICAAAHRRGYDVVVFNRGQSGPPPSGALAVRGDRTMISDLRHEPELLATPMVIQLYEAFRANDLDQVIKLIKGIFKNIPSHIFLSKAEAYYHSLIYLVFFYLGQYIESEVNTNNGRLDCVVKSPTHIYILEFKLDESAAAALTQIKERGYADKYTPDPRPKVLLGINFSSEEKTVADWLREVIK